MRSSSPFVWLTLVFVICLGLIVPAANAQFTIVNGPSLECLESGVPNDTIDAPEDSVRITVTMVGDEDFCDEVQIIFNPQPGLGVLPVVPTTYDCPTGDITGYPLTITEVLHNTPPGFCTFTGELTFRPENICIDSGEVVTFDLAGRGTDTGTGDVQCGQFSPDEVVDCNICIGCGYIRYIEVCGFWNDGIIAIGDSVWLDSTTVASFDTLAAGDTVYASFQNFTCDINDTVTFPNDTVLVSACALLENNVFCDTVFIVHVIWDAETFVDFWDDPAAQRDTFSYCPRPADNLRPEDLTADCLDSMVVINGNYIENDTLAGCGDTVRFYFSPIIGGSCPGGDSTLACGTVVNANHDVTYVAMYFGAWAECDTFPENSQDWLHCLVDGGSGATDTTVWLGGVWDGNVLYIDVPVNGELWCNIQKCFDDFGEGEEIAVWFVDDAGNSTDDYFILQNFTNYVNICIDNVPPGNLTTEIYYDDEVCNKRFSPYDSSEFVRYWRNLSPDSIRWYLDKIEPMGPPFDFDEFDDVYVIGFDVRQEADEDPDGPNGAIIAELNWLNPYGPYPQNWPIQNAWLDTFRWEYRDGSLPQDSACFTWYGKDGVDTLDAWLQPLNAPCPNGALLGITHARYMDMGGCNAVLGSDHDGMTDILEGYTTLNILHAVVDTCLPSTVLITDTLHLNPILPFGPAYPPAGIGANKAYWWTGPNGVADDPVVEFRAKRFFTQGLLDICLIEDLTYRIRVDSVVFVGTDSPYDVVGDTAWFFCDAFPGGTGDNTLWCPVTFDANSVNADSITFDWLHNYSIVYLPDGLYRLTLEIKDNAGNVYSDPLWIWLNGEGPFGDSVLVTDDSVNCNLNFFIGDDLCVRIETDTTADSVQFDWSCITNIDPSLDSAMLYTYDQLGDSIRVWIACITVTEDMIDTLVYANNVYQVSVYDADCVNPNGNRIINVQAYDEGILVSQITDPDNECDIAILGTSPCPRIVNTSDWFSFYDPDTLEVGSGTIDPAYENFAASPWFNAISPGSVDSVGAYDSDLNWANDQVQDSVFVQLFLDSATVMAPNIVGPDTFYVDSLVLQFYNPTNGRIREIRKALFQPACDNLNGVGPCLDWPNNSIYENGRLEKSEGNPALLEYRYVWLGTWYTMAGADSQMLVDWDDQDTIIVRAYTIAGDSLSADSTYLICDTLAVELDVDNINPWFKEWTGIAPGTRDPESGSTATVLNVSPDPDCLEPGFRFEDMEPFQFDVVMSEQVHHDALAYPDSSGSRPDINGYWPITRNWQISVINHVTQDIVIINGDTVFVAIDSVTFDHLANDSVKYHLYGHFNLPDAMPDTVIDDACLVIRSAWDQAGNPGRYNNPPYTDAYENDSSEDTTFCVVLVGCDPWAAGCPLVYGEPDGIGNYDPTYGWIAAEEDSVVVRATIIETCELTPCAPGVYADSIHVLEGNFQTITDDPNPWVVPDSVGAWFIFVNDDGDSLGWAREYWWWLVADSADLATIPCDGTYLPFTLRFDTYNNPSPPNTMESMLFDDCVQVDVNEPRWSQCLQVLDTLGDGNLLSQINAEYGSLDGISSCEDASEACIDPRDPFTISARFSDDGIDCINGDGIGMDTTQIWADLSAIFVNAAFDSVVPDTVYYLGANWWVAQWYITDAAYTCLADTYAVFRLHALYDSVGHHDRELYWQDSLFFCSDCLPPYLVSSSVWCDCDTMIEILEDWNITCDVRPLQYVSPGGQVNILQCWADPNTDSSLGLDGGSFYADLSVIDPNLSWTAATGIDFLIPPDTLAHVIWGAGVCNPQNPEYYLNATYNNGDTIYMDFAVCDVSGNCDTINIPIAIVDTLAAIVDFVYTIGDDSVQAYVTPGDQHVHIYADINGYVNDLVSNPSQVWANLSGFWCPADPEYAWYDTVYAHHVEQTGPDSYRAYWGWYPGIFYNDLEDTTSGVSDTLAVTTDCSCFNTGAEGTFDTLYFFVGDAACNFGSAFSVFEVSACDTTVPDVDSVWVMGASEDCAPGWFRGQVGDTIEVWAWLDSLFDGFEDTLRIDSMMSDLRAFGAIYNWTEITPDPDRVGGAPCYGGAPDWTQDVPSYWDIETDCEGRDRLVAKWLVINDVAWDCADVAWVPVKSQRQTGLNGSHGYYLDMTYGSGEAFTATYDWSVVWGDFTHVTGFPGDPDSSGIDSVLVLQNANYGLQSDSVMTVSVLMDNNCLNLEDSCVYDWSGIFIDFTGFLNDSIQYPDTVFCNVDGANTDSIVWVIPLYDGGDPVFVDTIASNRYWYPLWLSDYSACGEDSFVTQFCLWEDLDSVISFTIQNWNQPNPGMILICDSTTVTCDTNIADAYNMNLWNLENPFNGISSPDVAMENLYKVYTDGSTWAWYSHEDVNGTRFFVFVEDSVLQCDEIDNDADGFVDELGEGVDFYTADLRINTMPQVAHVDSMNVEGVWINYLWYADNFSEHQYDVDLFISDIYGHRDTLTCGATALTFFEDESCPIGEELTLYFDGEPVTILLNQTPQGVLNLETLTADDSIFVFANFDSIQLWIQDLDILDEGQNGSGVDLSTDTDPDSSQFNGSSASTIQLRGPDGNIVGIFAQTFYGPYEYFDQGPLTLSRLTDDVLPDGWYTVEIMTLDRMGNACNFSWSFILDQTCPDIVDAYTARAGTNDPTDDLFTSWDYVEIRTQIEDSLDGVDSVWFEYSYDANRDGNLDAYPYWQVANILSDEGGAWDTEYPFVVYWNIRNLPWSSEDTLGLPPVDPDTCMNRYFVRVRAADIYGHECEQIFPVDVTDDIGPVAAVIEFSDYDFTYGPAGQPQSSIVACFNPNTMTDSMMYVCAEDWIDPALLYDPLPGDSFTNETRWFDAYEGIMQYKFFEAPNIYNVGNTDPSAGWVLVHSGQFSNGQDTIIARDDISQDWCAQLNMAELSRQMLDAGESGHQFNLRFVVFDVCGNFDELNTPVITFRVECDTTSPLAVICFPEPDMCVTNYRCDSSVWVPVKATVPIFADVDSVAFFLVDSLSVPGMGIHTFIGGDAEPDSVVPEFAEFYGTTLNTNNLISGNYWIYAVAYDENGLFDSDPLWQQIFVDNTPPEVTACWIGNADDDFNVIGTTREDSTFAIRVFAEDVVGCGITAVQFQYLDRWGDNWYNLVSDDDINNLYGADVMVGTDFDGTNGISLDSIPDAAGFYEVWVTVSNFGNSPLDSIRFRAYAIDDVSWGDNNVQGDANRDCMIDRDQECGVDICCMAIEILDQLPTGTALHCYNHAWFEWALPQFDEPTTPIVDGDHFSTCNYQNPLDTLLLVALLSDSVEDEWLMHFVFWRSDSGYVTDTMYVPNNTDMNPAIPAIGPIALESTWDSVYVVWTGARAFIDSADQADGLAYSTWCFASYVTDVTGNAEPITEDNMCCLEFACVPQAPITHVSYVTNDVGDPENRVRVFEEVPYQDFVTDTIEVIYNRTTDPGGMDPEALVLFYTDAAAIMNCNGDTGWEFNLQLWELMPWDTLWEILDHDTVINGDTLYANIDSVAYPDSVLGRVCPVNPEEAFAFLDTGKGWDQFPPDEGADNRYVVGLYLDNSYGPGVYNFAMLVRDFYDFNEGDADLDGFLEATDSTRIDLVVRVVNVNEPQVVFCHPDYGDACGAHNTVPLSANDVSDPNYFNGVIDTVWFQMSEDGVTWSPITDPVTGLTYDVPDDSATVLFELDELEVPGMAGWYYERHSDPQYSWYAERDLFPDVAVYNWNSGTFHDMTESGNGFWTTAVTLATNTNDTCYHYSFVIDANDNGIYEGPDVDRWIDDPRDACTEAFCGDIGLAIGDAAPCSEICICEYMINFASTQYDDGSYLFRTVVSWHDDVAYHVIENPAPGDSLHVFFVHNVEPEATHDIEFSTTRLNGGFCDDADVVQFVTDIQPYNSNGDLIVEDICMVIYQVSLTDNPFVDSSWVNVDTVLSDGDIGWIEQWPGSWTAYNPIADNIDNDGDGLVDETYDVQAGDGVGEENSTFWSRSVVRDLCGNTYVSNAESFVVDVSEPSACITQVGDVAPPDNQVVMIPADRDLTIISVDQSYADPGVLAVFQYRTLNPIGPWTNIEADTLSNDTVGHVGNTYTAVWDLLAYFQQNDSTDPEGWFQLRTIAIDTVNNTDLCDNVVCQITIRLNDAEPAARIEVFSITSATDSATMCTDDSTTWYIMPPAPYCIRAFFAPTNIDTGLASLTFQYQTILEDEEVGPWQNIETIYDPINNGLLGDTTACVWFQPVPEEIGDFGFNIRVLVEDYNGNDTSSVITLYVDGSQAEGDAVAGEASLISTECGDRCAITSGATVSVVFDPDELTNIFNVDSVWMTALRLDSLHEYNFIGFTQIDDSTWVFDFEGNLCEYWLNHELEYGCYFFTVHFVDCPGNVGELAVTTDCGFGDTTLVCIDCPAGPPDHASLDCIHYEGWDCTLDSEANPAELTDCVLDGSTEIGNQTVTITGSLPDYDQGITCVYLWVESEEAGVLPMIVDSVCWESTLESDSASYTFNWDLLDTDSTGTPLFPSGYYRVWVLAMDANCQLQDVAMADEFWVHVDNACPTAVITQINGAAPNPAGADTLEIDAGEENPATFWVEWWDGLTPDDSTQAHNQVQLWAKDAWHPNQSDAWTMIGEIPSPCNPHYVLWYPVGFSCGDTLHIVAVATDRWENCDLSVDRAMAAYDSGLFVDVIIIDTTPPTVQLWALNADDTPDCDEEEFVRFDQQSNSAQWSGAFGHDVWLHAFSGVGDYSIERVYFEFSHDGTTWFEIAVDDDPSSPDDWNCEECPEPQPWWCMLADDEDHEILWTAYWDVAGLEGDIWVRVRAEDQCGLFSEWGQYVVSIDVAAPMARVFVWESDVHVDELPCEQWTEEQIGDSLERLTEVTLGACPTQEDYDAYGTIWYIKRADDHPLELWSWCYMGDDSTGPFSAENVNMWNGGANGECPEVQPGTWYDIAVLTTDQNGNELTWTQFLNHAAEGLTWEEKWAWLIENGYVKRFLATDHTAPVAHSLEVDTDCTPDSSVIFLHGNVMLSAMVDDLDVVAVTFAVREAGAEGPWTIIERVEGAAGDFSPVEGYWNTELLNGTYVIGAFAEDAYGNIDGDLSGVGAGPTNTLTVNVDNEPAQALIVGVYRTDDPNHTLVDQLERGEEFTFEIEASDNFTVRKVRFYYRHAGGDPDAWVQVGGDRNWPFSFNWVIPTDFVVGWTYDFMAVGVDYCEQTDYMDAQGNYIIDWSAPVVDEEANISIVTIGGQDAETTPHIHGTDICIVAHSEPLLDHVRFIYVSAEGDTTEIRTIEGEIGWTEWSLCEWDVTVLPEGPAQVCAIGSADLGGELVTMATDCRNIVIDHTVPAPLAGSAPASHGLVGGECSYDEYESNTDDLWIRFAEGADSGIDSVWFEWKWAADPDDETFWSFVGPATRDDLTENWAYAWDATQLQCGLITLRAHISDNAVPESNEAVVIFADSVRVDNCAPTVDITNINGDVTPDGTQIPQGQVATIVATVDDPFSQGGNSAIDSVCFYYIMGYADEEDLEGWILISCDTDGSIWDASLNTGGLPFGEYTLRAIAWDEAGNCGVTYTEFEVIDQLYQRAWIVGFDIDNGLGCLDHIWAVTDDCPPNFTTRVHFEYTVDDGANWIALGEDLSGTEYCDEWLDYNVWGIDLEFDAIPAGAVFRAVATDESNNDDPDAPRFRFSDVSESETPVVYHQDWVKVPVAAGQVPWVFSTLEDYTEACPVISALVCVEPVEGDPTHYAGPVPNETLPCNLNGRDGQLTIFGSVPVTQGNFTYTLITSFELNIHAVTTQGGSNGWLTSEDEQMELFIPANGAVGTGTVWFEPTNDDENVNLIPPSQYYYTLLSEVENVMSNNLGNGSVPSHFRFDFDPELLPPDPQEWQVVVAYWDGYESMWNEIGIVYLERDFENGIVDFQWVVDWDVSFTSPWGEGGSCPNTARLAVFLTTVQPLSAQITFSSDWCDNGFFPDSTYYTPERGVTTNCDPTFCAVLRQGEFVPDRSTIDVYLDGIRIVNDGEADEYNGDYGDGDIFNTSYNEVSGLFCVWFNDNANEFPPWFGCLSHGQHHIQFFVDNQSTDLTPFFVDLTWPEAYVSPGYINHQITLWADLTDPESGIDTNSVHVELKNCLDIFEILEYDVESEAMTFEPIPNGYRASFQLQWEQIAFLFEGNLTIPMTLCVEWEIWNLVCDYNEDTHWYIYTVDIEGPQVIPVSPVGAGIDEDGDGLINEDWRDCINNDNDFWWDDINGLWHERIDEDPVNFMADTINCGERPTIEALINDLVVCGSGASGVDLTTFWLNIDGTIFTMADTTNEEINFHLLWPYGADDAYFTFGGPPSGEAADQFYTPGDHSITVAAADSAGNIGSQTMNWHYYVRCGGPSIDFQPTECGVWFNPEGANNQFTFCVESVAGVDIMPNGIRYEVRTIPDGTRISGPTTIDPDGLDSICVDYFLGASFIDGQTGVELIVDAYNTYWNPEVDTINGVTHSRMTYWADNCAPTCVSHTPADLDSFSREEAIVVEVFFTDDCETTPGPNSIGDGDEAGMVQPERATVLVGRRDSKGNITPVSKSVVDLPTDRTGRGDILDDNGSGINLDCFDMNIYDPEGANVGPETSEDFDVLNTSHAKFILPSGQNPGTYTVNVTLCDCVGNFGGCTWQFRVTSVAPSITFCPVEDSCSYQNYWNPDLPLRLCATIREADNVNTNESGIRVDILRVYNCEDGLCTDTLVAGAEYDLSEQPDPNNRNQVFTITGAYNLDVDLATVELRLVVSATNVLGQTQTRTQPWIVDGTPPTISIVSPLPNSVVSNAQAIVISADFSDVTGGGSASIPGRKDPFVGDKGRGAGRLDDNGRGGSDRNTLGAWKGHVAGGRLDDLDGDSGIDLECIELILIPLNGGEPQYLTDGAITTPNNITWIGNLEEGGYTVVLTICDRVCNTASINWNFTVTSDQPCFIFADPCYVSAPQHTFIFRRACENIDLSSLRLTIEGQDSMGYVPIIIDAPVQSAGDSSWYPANIPNLGEFSSLRLTLTGTFNGGAPLPTVTHICVVDVFGPEFTSVSPNPADTLLAGEAQTFVVTFVERGNTTLNGAATVLRLTRDGEIVAEAGEGDVVIDPAGTSGSATAQSQTLAEGNYILYAYVEDIAGNSTTGTWTYFVREEHDTPIELSADAPFVYPNPFLPGETANFRIPLTGDMGSAELTIKIYDFGGRYVATVWDGSYSPSAGDPIWSGQNEDGEQVANGVYLAHVRTSAGGKSREDILKVAFKNAK